MKKLIQIFWGVLLATATLSAYAQSTNCTVSFMPARYSFPTPDLRDLNVPDGTVLYSERATLIDNPGSTNYNCKPLGSLHMIINSGGLVVPGGPYATVPSPISGIGYRLSYSGNSISGNLPVSTPAPQVGSFSWASGQLTMELVKTGPISGGGSTPDFSIVLLYGTVIQNSQSPAIGLAWINFVGGRIDVAKKPTCSVSTPSIGVDLGRIPLKSFSGVGIPSLEEKPFSVSLTCSGGTAGLSTNIYSTLTDQTNPANQTDTLTLTANSTARGVGIQVLSESTVIKYGPDSAAAGNLNQWFAGSTGNGTFTMPFTARLIQTSPVVTAGSVNGRATFTMSYQ